MQEIRKSECTREVQSNARQGSSHVRSRVVMWRGGEHCTLRLSVRPRLFLSFEQVKGRGSVSCPLNPVS